MSIWLYTILSVLAVSLVSLAGLFTLSMKMEKLQSILPYLVCLAAGAMFGNAFLHLIPEAFEVNGEGLMTPLLILTGIFAFFIVEKGLHCRHECAAPGHEVHPIGYMSLLADILENFIDGAIIGAAYLVSPATGLAATVAVVMHEIPTEIGDFGVLVHAGFSKKKALALNFTTALAGLVGAIVSLTVGSVVDSFEMIVLPLAAGCFVYLAAAGLLPRILKEQKHCGSYAQVLWMLVGVGIMLALCFLE